MPSVQYISCPDCGWRFYIGPSLQDDRSINCICPRCKREFRPEDHVGERPKKRDDRSFPVPSM